MTRVYERLAAAIHSARAGHTQGELADAIGATQRTVSDWERTGKVPLHMVPTIEDALKLGRGELLVKAGLVDRRRVPTDTTTQAAIHQDPDLNDEAREALLGLYDYARRATKRERVVVSELRRAAGVPEPQPQAG